MIRPYTHTPARATLVVGVSGGIDSLTLLHLLRRHLDAGQIVVAHLNHGLRPQAAADAAFVAQTAAAWNLRCEVGHADVAAQAAADGLTLEEAGRRARYDFLARTAEAVGARLVAVAHNADDQAETILMHLLRGSGLAGLRGMQPVSPLPGAPAYQLLRPLLTVSRRDIAAYGHRHHLTPVSDASNQDMRFWRNRIRHDLLPLLAEYNPQAQAHLQQFAALAAADYALLDDLFQAQWPALLLAQGDSWLRLDKGAWLLLPLSWRRQALRQAVLALCPTPPEIGFRVIEQARRLIEQGHAGGELSLPGGLRLHVGYHELTVAAAPARLPRELPQLPDETPLVLPVPGEVALADHWVLAASVLDEAGAYTAVPDPWQVVVDIGAASTLLVRPRQPGERFQPLGLGGHSASLKEVMINRRISRLLRRRWPIVVDETAVVWLTGHQLDERVRVTPASRRLVRLRCFRRDPGTSG